jgi:hypothetical protein
MALNLGKGCQDTAIFIEAHKPLAYPANKPPKPIPKDAFPVGSDFFTAMTAKELQALIDTTWDSRKKLDFTAKNAAAATAAKAYLEEASSSSKSQMTVRWGIHQHDDRPTGVAGKAKHFTMIASPADWHLYVNTDGSRIAFMSQTADAKDMVTIKKF